MLITEEQLAALAKAPATEIQHDLQNVWDIRNAGTDDDYRLEVKYNAYQVNRSYERYITGLGDVERWDEDKSMFVPATWEPLEGTLPSFRGEKGGQKGTKFLY